MADLAFDRALDLIITLDDATNEIYSAFLVEEEGTFSSFRGLAKVFAVWGLPLSLYSDRGSHYFFTPKAGEKVDPRALTQVGRGLAQLGIEHIAAYSPQARGRCERMFRTLQDRLPKELALAGIADMEAANRFIADVFLPAYNARFAVTAAEPGSAFVPVGLTQWQDVLCVQEQRVAPEMTTPWPSRACGCKSRPAGFARTSSKPRFASINTTPTARMPYSTGRNVSPATMPTVA